MSMIKGKGKVKNFLKIFFNFCIFRYDIYYKRALINLDKRKISFLIKCRPLIPPCLLRRQENEIFRQSDIIHIIRKNLERKEKIR